MYYNKEITFHNIATFHTTIDPYISNSDTLSGTISISTAHIKVKGSITGYVTSQRRTNSSQKMTI